MARYGDHREGMGGLGVNDPGLGQGLGPGVGQGPSNKPDLGQKETPKNPGKGLFSTITGAYNSNPVQNFLSGLFSNTKKAGLTSNQTNPMRLGAYYGLNSINFQPSIDEDGTINTGIIGKPGVSTFNKLDINKYKYNPSDYSPHKPNEVRNQYADTIADPLNNMQGFLNAGLTFDENNKFTGTDFDKLKAYTDALGMTYTGYQPGDFDFGDDSGDNNRPISPYVPIDPVRSKYEDEALEAYDRYIENGYSPEEAEYLVAYMGLA